MLERPCVLWTGPMTYGYGQTSMKHPDGKWRTVRIHRLVCEFFHGPPPPGKYQCMHACDVRNCYEPSHLSWGSGHDNMSDASNKARMRWGVAHHYTKLEPEQVLDIRRRAAAGEVKRHLAAEYGLAASHVSRLTLGQSWKHL